MATTKPTFKTFIEKSIKRGTMPSDVYESRAWYRQKATKLVGLREVSTERFYRIGRVNKRLQPSIKSRLMLGRLFMFQYEAKTRETLPYYDKFPCVFPFESHSDGFLGFNMHYLPYIWRARLMDNLYDLTTNNNMDKTTKLRLMSNGYNILNKSAKYRYFKPCVKKYLYEHVNSRFMEVPPDEWEIAIFLPLERFTSESGGRSTRKKVWMDTRQKYQNQKKL
jgi:hypothetical protein